MSDDILSLRNHLMNWLFTPLFVLWVFSTATGYIATIKYANRPYDSALLERAEALAAQLTPADDGKNPLPNRALSPRDEAFYTLYDADGRHLAGNVSLPRPPEFLLRKTEPVFTDAEYRGIKIRMVVLHLPGQDGRPIRLQLAEQLDKRQALIRGILANIVIPQLMLILMAGAAVWYALKRGLAPLEHLRQEVAERSRTDLRQLSESKAPDEVRPLIHAFNQLLQRLSQVLDSQKRFVADAAHQLRTPFAGLKTQAELALRETDPDKMQNALRKIHASAERCNHLVNQLLALARNEPGGHLYSSLGTLELGRLAQEATMHWVPEALRKDIDLGFEAYRHTVPVKGDPLGLTEMLNNLLDNAIRYTQPGGRVTVSVGYDNGGGVLRVEDDGPGIPPDQRDRVFERFYRILGSGEKGSGLGLSIVKEVAELHHATVELGEGPDGHGLRVTLRFPHHHSF